MTTNWFRTLRSHLGLAAGRIRKGSRRGKVLCEAARNVVDALESRTMLTVCVVNDIVAVRRLDVTLTIDVLANDAASNGAMVLDSFTQPAHGTVALVAGTGGARDRLAYTPSAEYAGTDAFAYTILDDDGVPETAGVSVTLTAPSAAVDPGGPRGAGFYSLSDGFVVGAFTTYTRSALGNFTFTDSKSTVDSLTWTDSTGIAHNVSSSGSDTLAVTSTEAGDGSWTYDEALTSTGDLTASPVSETQGLSEMLLGTYQHTFLAAGGAAGSSYTFSASGSQGSGGSSVYAWNVAGESLGSTTTLFTNSASFSADVSNTFDASTSTSTGTSIMSGSSSSFSTTNGTYTYIAGAGTVSGTIAESESYGDSYSYTASGGNYTEDGKYSYLSVGGVGETYAQSASETTSYHLAATSTFSGGAWTESGSASFSDDSIYTGDGTYATAGSGGSVSGTSTGGGGEHLATNSHWTQALGTDGKWQLRSGSASGTYHASGQSAYSGAGDYSRTASGGGVDGTLVEAGSGHFSTDSTWGEIVDATGQWRLDSGTSEQQVSSSSNWSYTGGGGSYVSGRYDGMMNNTMTESAGGMQSATVTVNSQVVSGVWVATGSAIEHAEGHDDMSYGGNGFASNTASGIIMLNSGTAGSSYEYDATEAMGVDGNWYWTSGSATNSQYSTDNFSFSDLSSYSTGAGSTWESGEEHRSYQLTTNSWLGADGQWSTSGSVTNGLWGTSQMSYSESAAYTGSVGDIALEGSTAESDTRVSTYNIWTTMASDGDGICYVSGGATTRDVFTGNFTYSGSGSTSFSSSTTTPVDGGETTETTTRAQSFSESGSQSRGADTQISWALDDGGNRIATDITSSDSGSGTGTYSYDDNTTVVTDTSWVRTTGDATQSLSLHQCSNMDDTIAVSSGYSFGRSLTISLASDGSQVMSGTGDGTGWEDGQANQIGDTSWSVTTWFIEPLHTLHIDEVGSAGEDSSDFYRVDSGWSESYGDGWASNSTWGSYSGGGSRSTWSGAEVNWWEWFGDASASGGDSASGSSSFGSAPSSTSTSDSYLDRPLSPGFSAESYNQDAAVVATIGSRGSPVGPGQGTPPTSTSNTPMAGGAAGSSGDPGAQGQAGQAGASSGMTKKDFLIIWLAPVCVPGLGGVVALGTLFKGCSGGCGKISAAVGWDILDVTKNPRWDDAMALAMKFSPANAKAIQDGIDIGHVHGISTGLYSTTSPQGGDPEAITVIGLSTDLTLGDLAMEIVAEGQRRRGLKDQDRDAIQKANDVLRQVDQQIEAGGGKVTRNWLH